MSLIVPLTLLAYWNFNTLSVILRRRRLRNKPSIDDNNSVHPTGSLLNIENATGSCAVTATSAALLLNSGLHKIISPRSVSKADQSKIV